MIKYLQLLLVVLLIGYSPVVASATIYFFFGGESSEGYSDGNNLPYPADANGIVFCGSACGGKDILGYIEDVGGAPEGNHYYEWYWPGDGSSGIGVQVKDTDTMHESAPINLNLSDEIYIAVYLRFERIGGVDIWHESSQSTNKHVYLRGNGIHWTIGTGHWDDCRTTSFVNNDNHRWTTYGGNPTDHLNGPDYETYGPNQSPYSCASTWQMEYERWYSIVLGFKLATDNTGWRKQWVNGVLYSYDNNIKTSSSANPTVQRLELGGTMAQPAYDAPAHYVQFDAIMVADSATDITNGGYFADPEGGDGSSNINILGITAVGGAFN